MRVFQRQGWHLLALASLLVGLLLLTPGRNAAPGEFLGLKTKAWFWLAVAIPVAHQAYVWLVWRLQLHFRLPQRLLGHAALPVYGAGFMVLFGSRILALIGLAVADAGSLSAPKSLLDLLAVVLAVPTAYLMYSVIRYFGLRRALGADHFEAAYRTMPMVKQGIYRYTDNGMYAFGFLGLYIPGLAWASGLALWVALFSHAYVWVHYYCTEVPDMRAIYGPPEAKPFPRA